MPAAQPGAAKAQRIEKTTVPVAIILMQRQYAYPRRISRFCRYSALIAAFIIGAVSPVCDARVLEVGPGKTLRAPSAAAEIARNGDIIEITAGVYRGDVAIWRASNLTIRGVGGRVHMESAGKTAGRKAIWVIAGDNTLVENINFSGAVVPDHNGAGIRQEGTNLTVRHCVFRDNEMGILAGRNPRGEIRVEHSEFFANTVDYERWREPGHNIYIGRQKRFIARFNWFHGAVAGHNIKSRAVTNIIQYNLIEDGPAGQSSYLIDIPNGGRSILVGNIFRKGAKAAGMISINFGSATHALHPSQNLFVVNNSFHNGYIDGIFIRRVSSGRTVVINNVFRGTGSLLSGVGDIRNNILSGTRGAVTRLRELASGGDFAPARTEDGNLALPSGGGFDPSRDDLMIRGGSPAIDAGAAPGYGQGVPLMPISEYVHPLGKRDRPVDKRLDIGPFEFSK